MQRYNSDLANDFGNLLSRVTTLIHKNYAGEIPDPGELSDQELSIKSKSEELNILVKKLIGDMKINEAIEEIMQFIRNVNKYMEKNAPWKMVKEDKVNAGRVLYTAGEALRIGAVLLSPVMPNRTLILLDALTSEKYSYHWGGLSIGAKLKKHSPLFPRLK
jgi:methionyl-tRNA synthetase